MTLFEVVSQRLSTVARSPMSMAVGRFVGVFASVLSAALMARELGPEGRGTVAAVLSMTMILPVAAALGVPLALRRRLALRSDDTVLRTARMWPYVVALPILACGVVLQHILFGQLLAEDLAAYYGAVLSCVLAVSWAIDANVLVARRQFWKVGIVSSAQSVVQAGLVVALWFFEELSISTALYSSAAASVVAFILGRFWVRGRAGRAKDLPELAREGVGLAGGVLSDVAARRADQVLALPVLGAAGAGLYAGAQTFAQVLTPVIQAYANGAFSGLVSGHHEALSTALRRASSLTAVLAIALGGVTWWALPVILGPEFEDSRPIAMICIVSWWVYGLAYVVSISLAATGRGPVMTLSQSIGLVVGLGSFALFGHFWGVVIAAIGMLLGNVVGLVIASRAAGVGVREMIPRPREAIAGMRELMGSRS